IWYAVGRVFEPAHFALWTLAAAAVVTAVGIPASTIVAREAGREDPGFVVIDEVAGQLLALVVMPVTPVTALVGLVLFRVFDIWKPWPVRKIEDLPEGTGIMLDDVAAGVIAMVVGLLIVRFVPFVR
ncbi:MAG: phosphatidylglycerophosphatase A, partial [Bryocella sp.]